MKAAVYTSPGNMEMQEVALGPLQPGYARIRVRNCGICGSDIHGYLGATGRRTPPMIMGHEFSGAISALGEGVTGFVEGDRVTMYPLMFCGECEYCKQGLTNLCPNGRVIGTFDKNGAMAEYVDVKERYLVKLPDAVPFDYAAMAEPCAVAYRAVKRAGPLQDKTVLIIGAGAIGLFLLLTALKQKPKALLVSDLNPARLALAKDFGAEVVQPDSETPQDALLRLSGRRQADVTFEAVGVSSAVQQAIQATKNGGVSVWVGNSEQIVGVPMQEVVTREITVFGTHIYTYEEFAAVIDSLKTGELFPYMQRLLSKKISLEEAPRTFADLSKADGGLLKVLIEQN